MFYDVTIDGKSYRLELTRADEGWHCRIDGREVQIDAVLTRPDVLSLLIEVRDPRSLKSRKDGAGYAKGPRKLIAPMPGKVVRVLAPANSEVNEGQGVIVVEAMKMQNEIKSPKKGIVQKVLVTVGVNVNAGDVLAIVE